VSVRPEPPYEPRRERVVKWVVRFAMLAFVSLSLGTCYARCGERPSFMALRTEIDGPPPATARKVLVFLHGYGGSIGNSEWLRDELRKAKVSDDVTIVLVDGPYSSGLGRSWGDTPEQVATSIRRVESLIESAIPESTPASQVVISGFSQGASIASDVAAAEPRVGALASLSGCQFQSQDVLAQKKDLRVLVTHGNHDSLCPVSKSRALVDRLRAAGSEVSYVEFQGDHVIAPEAIAALAELLRS